MPPTPDRPPAAPAFRPRPGLGALARTLLGLAALALAACQSIDSADLAPQRPPAAAAGSLAEERAHAVLVVDATSGRPLYTENADALRYPASLTKMMTLYLLFEAVKAGRLSLDSDLPVSPEAAARPPTKIGVRPGTTIRARDAAQAIATHSANDCAVVVAEALAGSEPAFVAGMNAKARALGMTRTRFVNASGLPAPGQFTTARDMATLGRALRQRFPQFTPVFAATEFSYGGRRWKATNKLLGTVDGVDGMKTGYTRAAGYNLVASAARAGRRIIVVVLGGASSAARNAEVAAYVERYLG